MGIDRDSQELISQAASMLELNPAQTEAVLNQALAEPVQQFSDEQSLHACLSLMSRVAETSRQVSITSDQISSITANSDHPELLKVEQSSDRADQTETVLDLDRNLSLPESTANLIIEPVVNQAEPQTHIEPSKPSALNTIAIVVREIETMPTSPTKQFFQRLTADIKQQAIRTTTAIQQGLESERFQSFKATVQSRAKADTEKTFQAVGQGIASAGNWIASLPEAKREHQAAQTVLALHQYGFDRTQEKVFRYEGFQVRLEGRNQFVLNDQAGNLLLKFKAEKPLLGTEPRITITGKSKLDISKEQYAALEQFHQRPQALRRGTDEAEQQYAQKAQFVANAVRKLGPGKGSHFEIKQEDGALTVHALDGRKCSEILRLEPNGRIESALLKRDFDRFITLHQKLAKAQDKSLKTVR